MITFSRKAIATALAWGLATCAAIVAAPEPGQGGPGVGDPAPLLKATTLLQAPPGGKLDAKSLQGKVVVLEFWATWCGPCVAAIPHLNDLAEKFNGRPVQFVAITSESESVVKAFLAQKPIQAWVALDADKAMHSAYAVQGIPRTVILGKDGLIAAITLPTRLTEQYLEDLLAAKNAPAKTNLVRSVGKSVGRSALAAGGKPAAAPLFEVSVRPSDSDGAEGSASGGGSLSYRGYTVLKLLPEAFEGASRATVWPQTPLPEGRYDVTIRQPKGHTVREAHELLWQALQSAFPLTARKVTNDMEVLVLRAGPTNGPGLMPAGTKARGYHMGAGELSAVNTSLGWLAWTLEDKLNKPVIDETGLTNRYDVFLKWEEKMGGPDSDGRYSVVPNPEGLCQAVREQLGLKLVPSTRPVVGFIVSKRN